MWQKTVNDMYNHTKTANTPLLSSYNAPFWNEYLVNFTRYDKLFRRLYKSFWYFDQLYDDSIAIVTNDFTDEVYNHLLVNSKKYSELYRIYVVDDDSFSVVDNYNITESLNRESGRTTEDVYGQRNDSRSESFGARSDSITESIGQRSDSSTESIGQRSDSKSETIGSRQDSSSYTQGAQNNQSTTGIEGFNSSTFQDADKTTDNIGQRSDSNSSTIGSQSNSESFTSGAQSNSKSATIGAQSNSKSTNVGAQSNSENFVKGNQSDSHTTEDSESYTLTRNGNIGIKTAQEVLKEQKELWTPYEFYTYIFRDIAKELLMV